MAETLETAAHLVEAHSAGLARELRLRDLVLTQIIFIVGPFWVGVAGKIGAQQAAFWILATILFFVPLAATVIFLNRHMPLEGGLYQWAKLEFGEAAGFLVGWNIWLNAIVTVSLLGIGIATSLSYAMGPRTAWMATSTVFMDTLSIAMVGVIAAFSMLGLGFGKWVYDAGGFFRIAIFAALILLPFANLLSPSSAPIRPVSFAAPALSLYSLNILGKMGFGAFSGFEQVAIFAGESENPARAIGRSVTIAGPIVTAIYLFGTFAMLAFVAPPHLDLIAPVQQAISIGSRSLGPLGLLVPLAIIGLAIGDFAYGAAAFASISRLPMVAGWDGIVPRWFTRLDPVRKTPTNSILFVAVVSLAVAIAGLVGVGPQEAAQEIMNAALIFYALAYLVMFAIPVVGLRSRRVPTPGWLRVSAASGFAMTLLYIVLAVFPIIEVENSGAFTLKMIAMVVAGNMAGAAMYVLARRRR